MRVIILFTFFLAPLFGLASFPIENETTEFINEVSNQTSDTKTHWYWTWWAALLNVILILTPLAYPAFFGLLLRIIRIFVKNKNFWKWFFKILKYVALALLLFVVIGASQLK